MATYTGYLSRPQSLETGAVATRDIVGMTLPFTAGFHKMSTPRVGTFNDTANDTRRDTYTGRRATMFSSDFYYRIYTYETKVDFGNLVSPSTRQYVVWNAYPTPNFITTVAGDTSGLTLAFLPTPKRLRGIEVASYNITATLDGPSTVDTTLTLTFQDGGSRTLQVVYGRLLALQFRPDWTTGINERLEWATDVMVSYNGKEQRRRLRVTPRRYIEFPIIMQGADRQRLETILWSWQTKDWALPLWFDAGPLNATAAAGTTTLQVATTNLDYSTGGLVILTDANMTQTEVAEIQSFTASSITLKRAVAASWPASTTLVMPARPGRMSMSLSTRRFTYDAVGMRARFELTDTSAWTEAAATSYAGYPVLEQIPNWDPDIEYNYDRKVTVLDNYTGSSTVDDEAGLPLTQQGHLWTTTTRAERAALKSLLYLLAGRRGAMWVPTWTYDLTLNANTSPTAATIDVANIGYAKYMAQQANRNHIKIETTAGAVFYRKIIASTEVSATTERLTLNSTLGATLTPAQIKKISFIQLMRNAGDAVEIQHWTHEVADTALTLRGFNHDV